MENLRQNSRKIKRILSLGGGQDNFLLARSTWGQRNSRESCIGHSGKVQRFPTGFQGQMPKIVYENSRNSRGRGAENSMGNSTGNPREHGRGQGRGKRQGAPTLQKVSWLGDAWQAADIPGARSAGRPVEGGARGWLHALCWHRPVGSSHARPLLPQRLCLCRKFRCGKTDSKPNNNKQDSPPARWPPAAGYSSRPGCCARSPPAAAPGWPPAPPCAAAGEAGQRAAAGQQLG